MPGPSDHILVVTLAATYPDGEVGYVTGFVRRPGHRAPLLDGAPVLAKAPEARDDEDLIVAIDSMLAVYQSEIGEAYAMGDFTFTFHEAHGMIDLGLLMGEAFVRRAGISGTKRPNIGSGRGRP